MSFLGLIFKNPFRNKSRASLAIVGISIGIATIVILGAITAGLVDNVDNILRAGGSDFSVSGKSIESGTVFGTENINESWVSTINNIEGVNIAVGVYMSDIPANPHANAPLIGLKSKDSNFMNIAITKGKMYNDSKDEIILGKLSAEDLNKSVNDFITFNGKEYKVVGIFETGNANLDFCAFAGLKNVQTLDDTAENNDITVIYAKLDKDANVEEVKKKIEDSYGDNLTVISSLNDIESLAAQLDMINAATWGISLLAIIVGAVGIINTMVTAVYERTREIGVLKALGWRNRKILTMVLGESLVLTISAGIIGSLLGIIAALLINHTAIMGPNATLLTITPFIQAFGVAIIVGLIGGFYPAWRATRLQPTEALGYE
ncbi:MAG: FtsX-like permease family protein [Methanobrevibacter sp.]|nr:FtsX-like permease family protein [Methanobrevibacter sp.]